MSNLRAAGVATIAGAIGALLGVLVTAQALVVTRPEWNLHLAAEAQVQTAQVAALERIESQSAATIVQLAELRAELRATRPGPRAR